MTHALVVIACSAIVSVFIVFDGAMHALRWLRPRPPLRRCLHGISEDVMCLSCARERGAA